MILLDLDKKTVKIKEKCHFKTQKWSKNRVPGPQSGSWRAKTARGLFPHASVLTRMPSDIINPPHPPKSLCQSLPTPLLLFLKNINKNQCLNIPKLKPFRMIQLLGFETFMLNVECLKFLISECKRFIFQIELVVLDLSSVVTFSM